MKRKPIGKLISYIYRHNQKYITKKLKPYQIGSGGQHSFLKEILLHPGINQDQLTNDLKFDKATTARAVRQLEDAGYISRKIDENDRRSFHLYPTQKGLDFHPILQNILEEFDQQLTSQLTDEERNQLVYLLKKLNVDGRE